MKTTSRSGTAGKGVLVAAAVVALIACKQDKPPPGIDGKAVATNEPAKPRVTSPSIAEHEPVKARVTSPSIAELLAAVPGTAMALGFVDLAESPWSLVTGGFMLPLDQATRTTLDKELREHVDRYLGVDLSKLQYAIGFISGPPVRGAVLLKSVAGTPKLPGATDHEGGKLWIVDADASISLAIKGDIVVFGKDGAVREVLETLAGKRKPVTTENKPLVEWLRNESTGAALAVVAVAPKDLPLPPQIAGLQRLAMTVGARGFSAVVDGDDAAISRLQAMSDQAIAAALAEVETQHQAALAGAIPPAEGAMAIVGAAYARSYAARFKPRRDGNRLSVALEVSMGDPTMIVAGVGVLAAIAIPAFINYTKQAKARGRDAQPLPVEPPQ